MKHAFGKKKKKKKKNLDLVGVAHWIERQPTNQRGSGSIPIQGMCLDCSLGPQWGMCKRQPHIDVSLPFFLFPFPSL